MNNQLIKLPCAGSELLPRRSLCPDEEEVRVNGQLGKEETRGTKLSQSRISSDRLSRNEDHLHHSIIVGFYNFLFIRDAMITIFLNYTDSKLYFQTK